MGGVKHSPSLRFKGFTLAEVLIVLAIIGVVAALTIPTLMQNYQKKVIVTNLQKTIALLDAGFRNMMVDEGIYDDISQTQIYKNTTNGDYMQNDPIFTKYFKSHYKDGDLFQCEKIQSSFYAQCTSNCTDICRTEQYTDEYVAQWPHLAGQSYQACQIYIEPALIYHNNSSPLILNNGVLVWIYNTNYTAVNEEIASLIYVDVNGKKGPNQYGYDIQKLGLKYNGHILPMNVDTIHEYFDPYGGTIGAKRIKEDGWKMTY